jgi:hypothetical protein
VTDPDDEKKRRQNQVRIGIWVVVGAIAIYYIVSGLVGILGG